MAKELRVSDGHGSQEALQGALRLLRRCGGCRKAGASGWHTPTAFPEQLPWEPGREAGGSRLCKCRWAGCWRLDPCAGGSGGAERSPALKMGFVMNCNGVEGTGACRGHQGSAPTLLLAMNRRFLGSGLEEKSQQRWGRESCSVPQRDYLERWNTKSETRAVS